MCSWHNGMTLLVVELRAAMELPTPQICCGPVALASWACMAAFFCLFFAGMIAIVELALRMLHTIREI
jgi:hypothetical protein